MLQPGLRIGYQTPKMVVMTSKICLQYPAVLSFGLELLRTF